MKKFIFYTMACSKPFTRTNIHDLPLLSIAIDALGIEIHQRLWPGEVGDVSSLPQPGLDEYIFIIKNTEDPVLNMAEHRFAQDCFEKSIVYLTWQSLEAQFNGTVMLDIHLDITITDIENLFAPSKTKHPHTELISEENSVDDSIKNFVRYLALPHLATVFMCDVFYSQVPVHACVENSTAAERVLECKPTCFIPYAAYYVGCMQPFDEMDKDLCFGWAYMIDLYALKHGLTHNTPDTNTAIQPWYEWLIGKIKTSNIHTVSV